MRDDKEIAELIASYYEDDGYIYTAQYIRKYGLKEPLYGVIFTDADVVKREEQAKRCMKEGKTAAELGIPMHFEGVKDGN